MSDYCMPFGPQHPSIKEPISLKIKLDGNYVKSVDVQLGYIHRGIEKIFEGKNINSALYLAERICGICSYAHAGAYTQAMESMIGIEAPPRVKFLRTIMAELERLHSHLMWAGFMCHEIGFDTLFQLFWREREHVLDIFEEVTGNRVHHSFNKIGTVRYDIEDADALLGKLKQMEANTKPLIQEMLSNGVAGARLRKVGRLSRGTALKYCLVGPMSRACGVKSDLRKAMPYEAYGDVKFREVLTKGGDAYARAEARLLEIPESISIIRQCLEKMPAEKIPKATPKLIKSADGFGRVEAPRGEDFHYYIVRDSKISRAKIRTPTLANFKTLPIMLKGAEIGDVPVVVASLDPCIGCLERVMVIKDKRKEVLTEQEFRRKYCV